MQYKIEDITALIYRIYDLDLPKELDGKFPAIITLEEKELIAVDVLKKVLINNNVCLMFTGRKDSSVLLHLILKNKLKIPKLFFIDHGQHFEESLTHLFYLQKLWKVKVEIINTQEMFKHKKVNSYELAKIKIKALEHIIKKYKIKYLLTAIRRSESVERSNEKYFSKRKTHVRVHPLLDFNESDIWGYLNKNKIPHNPLYDKGLRSFEEKRKIKNTSVFERDNRDRKKEKEMAKLRALGYF